MIATAGWGATLRYGLLMILMPPAEAGSSKGRAKAALCAALGALGVHLWG